MTCFSNFLISSTGISSLHRFHTRKSLLEFRVQLVQRLDNFPCALNVFFKLPRLVAVTKWIPRFLFKPNNKFIFYSPQYTSTIVCNETAMCQRCAWWLSAFFSYSGDIPPYYIAQFYVHVQSIFRVAGDVLCNIILPPCVCQCMRVCSACVTSWFRVMLSTYHPRQKQFAAGAVYWL